MPTNASQHPSWQAWTRTCLLLIPLASTLGGHSAKPLVLTR
jgi:hypothetical protein